MPGPRLRRQGFHEWVAAEATRARRAETEADLATLLGTIHAEHRGAYGIPRITAELHRRGFVVNHKRNTAWPASPAANAAA
ncbi:IS3 family transposase [Amycolatopsis sp.]|uniref:IS3 family transposase n=1 Tax=Amycolatopsis sp. TaxID=37632 RepID=UPI0039C8A2F1